MFRQIANAFSYGLVWGDAHHTDAAVIQQAL